jgi:hypothetical protein
VYGTNSLANCYSQAFETRIAADIANAHTYRPRWRPRTNKPLWRKVWLRALVMYMKGAQIVGSPVPVSEAKIMAPALAFIIAASAIVALVSAN